MLTIEESLWIDGRAQLRPSNQLVIVGEFSGIGGEVAWKLRRTS
jgi:uncharacterized heparinase superfamily protein